MKLLDYHRLENAEMNARDPERIEAVVRAESAGFPEQVEALLPPPDDTHRSREAWPHFEQLRRLCDLYLTATPAQREWIQSKMTSTRVSQLGRFRREARERAVATQSAEDLRLAIVSLAMSGLRWTDARDMIMSGNALLLAARQIKAEWGNLIQEAASLSCAGTSALLLDLLRNHPE